MRWKASNNRVRLWAVIVVVVCAAWAARPIEGAEDERLRQVERVLNEEGRLAPEDFRRLGSALYTERTLENKAAIERILREHTPAILAAGLALLQRMEVSLETRRIVAKVADAVGSRAVVLARPFLRRADPRLDEEAIGLLGEATHGASSASAVIKGIREDVSSGLTAPSVALRVFACWSTHRGWNESPVVDAATLRAGLRWCLRPGAPSEDWRNLINLTRSEQMAATPDAQAILVAALSSSAAEIRCLGLQYIGEEPQRDLPESVGGAAVGLMLDPDFSVAAAATKLALDIDPESALRVGLVSGCEEVLEMCIRHLALECGPRTSRELSDAIQNVIYTMVRHDPCDAPLGSISVAAVRASATKDPWGSWTAPFSSALDPDESPLGRLMLASTLQHWGSRPEARGMIVWLLKDSCAPVRHLAAASLLVVLDDMPPARARSLAELGLASRDSVVSFLCGMWVWKSVDFGPDVYATVSAKEAGLEGKDLWHALRAVGVPWQGGGRASALRSCARAINEQVAAKGLKPIELLIRLASLDGE